MAVTTKAIPFSYFLLLNFYLVLRNPPRPHRCLREAAAGRAFRNSSVSQLSTLNSVKERGFDGALRSQQPVTP